MPYPDHHQAAVDRAIERRQHHDEFVKAHPELLTADVRAMDKALNEAERKALTRRFTGEPLTGFGELVSA